MTRDDLLTRTARYHIQEHTSLRRRADREYWEDSQENRPLSRRMESDTNRTIPPPISNLIPRSTRYDPSNNASTATVPSSPLVDLVPVDEEPLEPLRTLPVQENQDFKITTTCDDPSSDEEEPSSAATLADLYRRDHLPPPYTTSDEDDEDFHDRAMELASRIGVSPDHRRNRRRAYPRNIEVECTPDGQGSDSVTPDVMPPHALFFIEKGSSVISIKFDPPV